jgi:hypothetical protein
LARFFSGVSEKCNLRVLDSGFVEHFGSIGLMNEIDLFLQKKKEKKKDDQYELVFGKFMLMGSGLVYLCILITHFSYIFY